MYTDRGWVYLHLKANEQAISDFDSALALNAVYARAYARRGQAYRYLKDYQRAMSDYNRAIQLNPRIPGVMNDEVGCIESSEIIEGMPLKILIG